MSGSLHLLSYSLGNLQYGFTKLFECLLWARCSSKLFRPRPPADASSCRDSTKSKSVLPGWGQNTCKDDVYASVEQCQDHAWYVKEDSPPLHITHADPALNMLTKEVHPEKSKTVVEYSSGSTVISLALVSRINHGIQDVRAFLSNKTSAPKLRLMQFFGLDMYVSLLLTMNNF